MKRHEKALGIPGTIQEKEKEKKKKISQQQNCYLISCDFSEDEGRWPLKHVRFVCVNTIPWAAARNVRGHYKWHFFSLSLFLSGLSAKSTRKSYCRVNKLCTGF